MKNLVCCELCGFPATVRIQSGGILRYACADAAHQESAWAQLRQARGEMAALGDVAVRCESGGFPLDPPPVAATRRRMA